MTPMDEQMPRPAEQDLAGLGEIIQAYSAAVTELQQSHTMLRDKVRELTGEVQRKNHELSQKVAEVSRLKNYLAGIIDSSADAIVAIDLERRITAFNPSANVAAALCGEPPDHPEGMFILDVFRDPCREFGMLLMRAMQEDRRFMGVDIRVTAADGKLRWFSASASPVRSADEDDEARLVGAVLIFSEQTELRALEERANRQDRLAALGEMAAGVAHEIRNPLGGIELYASNLRRKFDEAAPEYATCTKIIRATTSLNRIVSDMLTFTRSRQPQLRRADAAQVARSAADMAARELEARGVQVRFCLPPQGRPCMLDPDQAAQAVLNVVLNAAQAAGKGTTVTITVDDGTLHDGAPALAIHVADEGPGIPADVKAKIFDPFFTLRKDGTGLGLAIVNKIMQDHGGAIDVADNMPKGTVFTFLFPDPQS